MKEKGTPSTGAYARMTQIERIRTDLFPAGQLDFDGFYFCFRKNGCKFNCVIH